MLRHLVANAIDASSTNRSAGWMAVRGSRAGDFLLIEVLDDGPGVAVDD